MGVVKDLYDYTVKTERKSNNNILYFDAWKERHPEYVRTPHEIERERQLRAEQKSRYLS